MLLTVLSLKYAVRHPTFVDIFRLWSHESKSCWLLACSLPWLWANSSSRLAFLLRRPRSLCSAAAVAAAAAHHPARPADRCDATLVPHCDELIIWISPLFRCWLRVDNHFIWTFIGPVTVIIVVSCNFCAHAWWFLFSFKEKLWKGRFIDFLSLGASRLAASLSPDQFAWKDSGPIISDTRTSVSTQLWNPLKSELASGNNLKLFGPSPYIQRILVCPAIRGRGKKLSQAWRSFAQWENKGDGGGGSEHGSNEWVGQTAITTAHSPAEDHDTSPANPSARTSPSSPFNISCGEMGVHNTHARTHARPPAHALRRSRCPLNKQTSTPNDVLTRART